jgi:hypothetical protein
MDSQKNEADIRRKSLRSGCQNLRKKQERIYTMVEPIFAGKIEEKWNSYRQEVLPLDAPPTQVTECKRAFYAGIRGVFSIQNDMADLPPVEFAKGLLRMEDELTEFSDAVLEGRE